MWSRRLLLLGSLAGSYINLASMALLHQHRAGVVVASSLVWLLVWLWWE